MFRLRLIILISFIYLCNLSAEDIVELNMNLREGDSYLIEIPLNMKIDMTMSMDTSEMGKLMSIFSTIFSADNNSGKKKTKKTTSNKKNDVIEPLEEKIQMNLNLVIFLKVKVIDLIQDGYNLMVSYNRFKATMNTDDILYEIDTHKELDNKYIEFLEDWNTLRKITEYEFFMDVSSKGDINNIKNYEQINYLIAKPSKSTLLGKEEKQLDVYEYLDVEKMKAIWDGVFKIYPENPVRIGDSWYIDTFDDDKLAPTKTTSKFTLLEINESNYVINYACSITDNNSKDAVLPVIINGKGEGLITLNKQDNFQQTQPFSIEMDVFMNIFGMNSNTKVTVSDIYKVEKL